MKKTMRITKMVIVALIFLSACGQSPENKQKQTDDGTIESTETESNTFTDSRDGKVYNLVTIGEFTIMAENFTFKPTGQGYMAYANDNENITKFGYLYTYETAKAICPKGWHIPSKEEFEKLLLIVGTNDKERFSSLLPGGKSGFNALYGGRYEKEYDNSQFINESAYFWTSTPSYQDRFWYLDLDSEYQTLDFGHFSKLDCRSVRYFKD